MVESVVSMMHRLQLEVVAEGVETAEQRAVLASFGCDAMQGYWFARPMDANACEAMLAAHQAGSKATA